MSPRLGVLELEQHSHGSAGFEICPMGLREGFALRGSVRTVSSGLQGLKTARASVVRRRGYGLKTSTMKELCESARARVAPVPQFKNIVFNNSYFRENSKKLLIFTKSANKFGKFLNFLDFSKIFRNFVVFS